MGTNFYHNSNICEKCGRFDEEHIGKSSGGWTFTWHGPLGIQSCTDWFQRLKVGTIRDEYGTEWTLEDFRNMVDGKRNAPHHHAREYPADDQWTDDDGCSFSRHGFS